MRRRTFDEFGGFGLDKAVATGEAGPSVVVHGDDLDAIAIFQGIDSCFVAATERMSGAIGKGFEFHPAPHMIQSRRHAR